jgi:hypothetical protein
MVRQTITVPIVGIGVMGKYFSDATNIYRGLQEHRGVVAALKLRVGKGIGGLYMKFDLFRIGKIDIQNTPVAVGVGHGNYISPPGGVSMKGRVEVSLGVVFEYFSLGRTPRAIGSGYAFAKAIPPADREGVPVSRTATGLGIGRDYSFDRETLGAIALL